jgi:hypothetical protein
MMRRALMTPPRNAGHTGAHGHAEDDAEACGP